MSDGAIISIDRLGTSAAPSPVVLLITPYRKESLAVREYAAISFGAGYTTVVADVRGIGGSSGPYQGILSEREVLDGKEVIEWICSQSFCDGQVALVGQSYQGLIQMLVAARKPTGLRCIAPSIAPTDVYRDLFRRGGIPSNTGWAAQTFSRAARRETQIHGSAEFDRVLYSEEFDGDWFRTRSPTEIFHEIGVPVLCLGGWFDLFSESTIRTFRAVQTPKRLVMGNWGHEEKPSDTEVSELRRWLDFWLRGQGSDPTAVPNVRTICVGHDEDIVLPGWPAEEDLHWEEWTLLRQDGEIPVQAAIESVPLTSVPQVSIEADLGIGSGMRTWGEAWVVDLPIVAEPMFIAGAPLLALGIRVEGDPGDFDLRTRISIVTPHGEARQLTEGQLRASHRRLATPNSVQSLPSHMTPPLHAHAEADPIPAGPSVTELQIGFASTYARINPGESLRLGLTLEWSASPRPDSVVTLTADSVVFLPTAPRSIPANRLER